MPHPTLSPYQLSYSSFKRTTRNLATPFNNSLQENSLHPGFQKSTKYEPNLPSCLCPLLPDIYPMLQAKQTICYSQNIPHALPLPSRSPTATTLTALLTKIPLVLQESANNISEYSPFSFYSLSFPRL